MRIVCVIAIALAISGPAVAQGVAEGNAAAPANAGPARPGSAQPAVAPRAEQLLHQAGAYLGSAGEFTFHADITFDHVLPSGQKLEFFGTEDVALKRPDRLYVEWRGDLGDRQFWYDGKTVTLYDPALPFYAAAAAPSSIDAMLEKVITQLGFSPPLSDFLESDPTRSLQGKIQYGFDLGMTEVGGQQCHSLGFVQKDIDWQIWIGDGPQPVPCKIVITYKADPSQPQFRAVFSEWDFAPRIDDTVFTADLPQGAQKIPFKAVASNR
ncbi:MAG: DUF2092 domain-containing protein [Stellaceae bacterium]